MVAAEGTIESFLFGSAFKGFTAADRFWDKLKAAGNRFDRSDG